MRLLGIKDVAERTGIPLGTLRFYMRTGKCPFKFRRLPSGKAVISEEELKKGIDVLPNYISTKETATNTRLIEGKPK